MPAESNTMSCKFAYVEDKTDVFKVPFQEFVISTDRFYNNMIFLNNHDFVLLKRHAQKI